MRKLVLLFFAVSLISGCSNGGAIPNEQSFVSGNGIATFIDKDARTKAPQLKGRTLDGKDFLDPQGKVQVVNVWASWCSPCRAEAPALQELSTYFPDVQFVGILTRDNLVSARAFVDRFGITYPTLVDDSLIARFSGNLLPNAIPTTLVIDKQGKVAARISGEITYSGLKDLISKVGQE